MGRRKRTTFEESLINNQLSYFQYLQILTELSVSMFEYKRLPKSVDSRYIELRMFEKGSVLYFNDKLMGNLCLDYITKGQFNVYGIPIKRTAYSHYNNYTNNFTIDDSVIIYNNLLRTNSALIVTEFAKRLHNIDRIIDVNINAQKTPILLQGTEKQRMTLLNIYKEYDGNMPVIHGDSNFDAVNSLKTLKTDAPFIAPNLYELKTKIWNECLTYLGINNVSEQKKERMVTDEVNRGLGGTIASRNSRLQARKEGFKLVNEMFGTDIEVDYKDNFVEMFGDGNSNSEVIDYE